MTKTPFPIEISTPSQLNDLVLTNASGMVVLEVSTERIHVPRGSCAQITAPFFSHKSAALVRKLIEQGECPLKYTRVLFDRFEIDTDIASKPRDWVVNGIEYDNQSIYAQSGGLPGDMFGNVAIDSFVNFKSRVLRIDRPLVVCVTYNGKLGGAAFSGRFVGKLTPDAGCRTCGQIDD